MNARGKLSKSGKVGQEAMVMWQFGLAGVALIVGLVLSVLLVPALSVAAPIEDEPCVSCAADTARYSALAAHYAARGETNLGASAARWNALAAAYAAMSEVNAVAEASIAASSARWNALTAHYVKGSASCGR